MVDKSVIYGNITRLFSYLFRFRELDVADYFCGKVNNSTYLSRGFGDNDFYVDVSRGRGPCLIYMKGRRYVKEENVIDEVISEGMTVIGVGANIGYYMLIFAEKVGETGKVICFEPNPRNVKDTITNKKENNLSNVVVKKRG
jgi:tRNA G37 N-methylase Trm5